MQTSEEMIEVIDAYSKGRKIEMKVDYRNYWEACPKPMFNFAAVEYRVVKEPREFYISINNYGGVAAAARSREGLGGSNEVIKVREVIEP